MPKTYHVRLKKMFPLDSHRRAGIAFSDRAYAPYDLDEEQLKAIQEDPALEVAESASEAKRINSQLGMKPIERANVVPAETEDEPTGNANGNYEPEITTALTKSQLLEIAKERGVEGAEELPNKASIVDAIFAKAAADATPATTEPTVTEDKPADAEPKE